MIDIKKDRIRNKYIEIWILNVFLLLPLLIFGGQNFSIDSYGILLNVKEHLDAFIGSFRWFGALIYKIYTLGGHNPILNSTIDILLFIILISVVMTVLTIKIVDEINVSDWLSYIIVDLGLLISVVNVWFCDVLSFPECVFLTGVGLALCFGAIIVFIQSSKPWQYLLSSIMLILSTGVYQQFISIYAVYIVGICGIRMINTKKSFLNLFLYYIKHASLIIISGVAYLLIGKAVQLVFGIEANSRVAFSLDVILENVKYFLLNQHSYIKGRGFFDTEILTFSYLAIGGIWFVLLLLHWKRNQFIKNNIAVGVSYILAYVATYLPGILSTSHAARAMFAVFSAFLLFVVGILKLTENRKIKVIVVVILSVVLIANIVKTINREIEFKEQNMRDEIWCKQVLNEIELYESREGIKIENIEFCHDESLDIQTSGNSVVIAKYAMRSIFNYYGEREFNVSEMSNEKKDAYFEDKDWSEYCKEEQLVFEDDTLYVCCY